MGTFTGGQTITITRDSSNLTVVAVSGTTQYPASFFKDRIVPTRLIVLLQGAGGAGGNGN